MRVPLGLNAYLRRTQNRDVPVVWDSSTAMNPHMLVVGGSGSGKTHNLRRMLRSMVESVQHPIRIHVFDLHGDLDVVGTSTVRFSEGTGYGQNPLEVDQDPHHGGVRRRIQSFIRALNRSSHRLGSRQEAVLRALLTDLYAANGFYEDRPESWRLDDGVQRRWPKKHPTVVDASRFAGAKLKALYLGADAGAVAALEQVNKRARTLYVQTKALPQLREAVGKEAVADPDLDRLKAQAIEAYAAAVAAIGTGRELDDLVRYDSKEVLRSVVDRLDNLVATGIFRPEEPPFDGAAPIWRYDLHALESGEQKLFVHFRLEELLRRAIARGMQSDVVEMILLDEAHRFTNDEPEDPINRIAKEARKFGLGLICSSQSPTHFSDDFLSNVGTKILLAIDEMYWDGAIRKLKIDARTLQYIVPRRTMAVQIKTSEAVKMRFVGVEIPQERRVAQSHRHPAVEGVAR